MNRTFVIGIVSVVIGLGIMHVMPYQYGTSGLGGWLGIIPFGFGLGYLPYPEPKTLLHEIVTIILVAIVSTAAVVDSMFWLIATENGLTLQGAPAAVFLLLASFIGGMLPRLRLSRAKKARRFEQE